MNSLPKVVFPLFLFVLSGLGVANASSVLVIGAEPKIANQLKIALPESLDPLVTNVRVDTTKEVITTDEGTEINSGALFSSEVSKSRPALTTLKTEYAPEFLLLGWVAKEETQEYASYGLELIELTIQVRLIDMARGKSVYETKMRHGTEFAADEIDEAFRQKVIAAALTKFDSDMMSSALASYIAAEQGIQNRLKVVLAGLDQETYFDLRDSILTAVTRAGVLEDARISYSQGAAAATVRVVTGKEVEDFYRELYVSLDAMQEIDGFEISGDGSSIDVALQPLSGRVISIKTLSPKDYGSIGRHLVSIVSDAPGVSDVTQSYSEKDQTLVIEFVLKGKSLYSVDGAVWSAIVEDARFKDFAMGKIDQREIEYFFSGREEAANSDVIVTLSDVDSEQYKQVATAFSDLISQITGVRDLRYRYDYEKKAVIYRFKYEADGIHSLDDAIVRGMLQIEVFKHTGKGPERVGHLTYVFNDSPEEADARITQKQGQMIVGSMSSDSDLAALDHSVVYIYSEHEDGFAEGTGFVVSESGYVLTNRHIIKGLNNYVRTFSGDEYRANLIKFDPVLDLALLQVVTNVDTFRPVVIGDSSTVQRGEPIVVIGNPSGDRFAHSVLAGIVSGINRERGLLQLSVTSYGGVSGAPVFNKEGAVIGVLTFVPEIDSETTITVGTEASKISLLSQMNEFGLAIPINYAKGLLQLTN